ncbi:MAG: Potassium efflux system KefA protein / Small-conductance mechanosensitive channel [uncultured Sulfurovum sp.]|uniref:Potassium efflux system KefA protein / Small-conductance mechanosensitive channel n=1 Tax=uncultured Sulfurovum sp. TaxID=269237 RepID=A0A6S6U2W2_9BACT|nr:MAG: Potassium efflux system KefA protein / Small-conductance mechanosensitive channel [uncultured Sulfurovum sp.]
MNESNVSQADQDLNSLDIETDKLVETLDINFFPHVQKMLNEFYNQEYGAYFTELYFNIPLGNIIAAIFFLIFFLYLRKAFAHLAIGVLQPLTQRTKNFYDDRILSALKGSIAFVFVIIGVRLFFALLFLEAPFIDKLIDSMILFNVFWAIYSLVYALRDTVYHFTQRFNPELSHEMGNFILTILRIIVSFIGMGAILQIWGVNIAGLAAGLGIGGLAFALAAKDTAANLFGSIALLLDKSIRIGEWIKIAEVEGTVEDIGMRTTKIRTFGKALITLPNQVIANSPIENFSRRGIRRIKMNIGLTYNTNSEQMKNILTDIKTMLRNHKDIAQKETMLVNFNSFDESSLGIFIYTFSNTANWEKYMDIKEDINLKIIKIIEDNHSSFAFPSQSLYVETLPENNIATSINN